MSCGPCALGTGVGGPNDVGLEGVAGGNVVWRWVLGPVGWRARGGVPVPKRGLEQLEVVYQQLGSGIQEFCQTFYVAQGLIRHFSNRRT